MNVELNQIVIVLSIAFGEYLLVLLAVACDLWSGLRKARERGEARLSYGYRRTIKKIGEYYNFMFAFSVMDAMQMIAIWYLGQYYGWTIPFFPVVTSLGAIAISVIEIKSIYEKADQKVRTYSKDAVMLASEIIRNKTNPDEIARLVAEYMNKE